LLKLLNITTRQFYAKEKQHFTKENQHFTKEKQHGKDTTHQLRKVQSYHQAYYTQSYHQACSNLFQIPTQLLPNYYTYMSKSCTKLTQLFFFSLLSALLLISL